MWVKVLRAMAWSVSGLSLGFLGPYAWVVDHRVTEDFAALQWQVPTRVMARPLQLQPGMPLNLTMLRAELQAAAYREDAEGADPGRFVVHGTEVRLTTRAFVDLEGPQPSRHLRLTLEGERLTALQDAGGRALPEASIDPARIATLYGELQEERRLLALDEVPELLLVSLQAVEDRDFKRHIGIDFGGIVRAAWTNLRHGEVRQGGSTLTQQLVRNLYLTREQTLWRKVREVIHALAIERRFSKAQILQAYVNQVFLGQDGAQAVHGFGAAAEFWFGRDVEHLKPQEIALLVGMIRGPSWYDPRRQPERAMQRRNSCWTPWLRRVCCRLSKLRWPKRVHLVSVSMRACGAIARRPF
jgi:penicillin-binding protein 1B